jgi:DNA mismatch repair ATPase MutS
MLPDATGHWAMATLLDRTHGRDGHAALKRIIALPLSDAGDITRRQQLLPAIAGIAPHVPWRELVPLLQQVDDYLGSNYIAVPASWRAWPLFAWRHRDIVAFADRGLRALEALLSLTATVYDRVCLLGGDATFDAIVASLQAVLHDPRRSRLRAAAASRHRRTLVHLDGDARGAWRDSLRALMAALWEFDAVSSLALASATLVQQHGGTQPALVAPDAPLVLEGLGHALLPDGVRNTVAMAPRERVLFVTGPNMAGKSTLLRAMGVAVHFAHLGMAVPARVARIPLFDRLLVSFSVQDNLLRGESLYLAEVRRVRAMVEAVADGECVLAICDEVFRGTNVKDARAATTLLVDGLACAPHGVFVIASHLSEVADARAAHDGIATWCMDVSLVHGVHRFTYQVQRGVSDVHLGMLLLDAEGVGPALRQLAARRGM